MIRETLISIFEDIWPMLLIFSVVLVSIRLTYLYVNKEKIVIYKELLSLFFILYILCLFHVVTFQDVSWSTSNFIPFKEMFRYQIGSRLFFKNVIGNMIMFFPYGFFISQYIKIKKVLYPEFDSVLFMYLYNKLLNENACVTIKQLKIDGTDLKQSGISHGPEIGKVLNYLLDAVIENRCDNTKDKLLSYLQNKYAKYSQYTHG